MSTVDQIEARALAIVDPTRSYESASECGKLAREALALVEVARALEEVARAAQAYVEADLANDAAIGALLDNTSPDPNDDEKLRDAQKETARALDKARDNLDAALEAVT